MNKSVLTFFAFLSLPLLLIGAYYLYTQKADSPTQKVEILADDSGAPIMATGNCNANSDCFPTGCSSHICSNHELMTTCEIVDFPEKETYACGCIQNRCVWYR